MENQQPVESVPVNDTEAEKKLTEFVAANRQHVPPLPTAPAFEQLAERIQSRFVETLEQTAEREGRTAKQSELRRLAELRGRAVDLLQSAGARYRDCTLDNFRCDTPAQRKIVDIIRDYVSVDCADGMILYGPVGTGKDHLAFAVCRAAVKAGKTVRWLNGQSWFGIVRDAMDTDRSEASLIASLAQPELLCLSDPLPPFGPLTQFQATMLYRLVDARYSRGLPTICTVNVCGDSEADERMGAATWDRLCHGAYKLRCDWATHRSPKRDA